MKSLSISTKKRMEFIDISSEVQKVVDKEGKKDGMIFLYVPHTTAGLTINENADPTVRGDMESHFNQMIPEGAAYFVHTYEGPDDMPAHVRSILTQSDLNLPVSGGRCALGTWQGVYLWEHRHAAHSRRVIVTVQGD